MNYEIVGFSRVYLILTAEVFIHFLNGYGTVNKTRAQTASERGRETQRDDPVNRESLTDRSCAESRSKPQSSPAGAAKSGADSNFPCEVFIL